MQATSLVGRDRELARFETLLAGIRAGGSASLLIVGDPGVGKSALLERLVVSADDCQVVRAAGVEGEVDLPYSGLHQLCRTMLDEISALPEPQSEALRVAFGLAPGEARDRYLVGLAVLGLLSEVATSRPLLCVVDDAQWLDHATTQALAFVARRLGADSTALVIASRKVVDELGDVALLELGGLAAPDARTVLDSVLIGRLEGSVRERFLAETRGNPLALLELPHTLTPAEAASGILGEESGSLSGRIEESFRRRLEQLPDQTRQLLVVAAAEPGGDPLLVLRAAEHLRLPLEAADVAVDEGLLEVRERWMFRHPLVRSAAYRSASQQERRSAHGALAAATDEELDADRKAWHRAQATAKPDEEIAAALEQTATRAKARGGLAAAGAFLERAALLTPDAATRAERTLAAAEVLLEAGAFDTVDKLLRSLEGANLRELQAAQAERMRALLRLEREVGEMDEGAVLDLLAAADRLKRLDPALGRAAHIDALERCFTTGRDLRAILPQLDSDSSSGQPSPSELILLGWAKLLSEGFPAGTDLLRRAMVSIRDASDLGESELPIASYAYSISYSLWDFDSWGTLSRRSVELARRVGALRRLPEALLRWAAWKASAGDFRGAAALFAEMEAVAEATGQQGMSPMALDALACDCDEALRRIDEFERRWHRDSFLRDSYRALALNGGGRYEEALECAQRACDAHPLGTYSVALVELVEAATRCGESERARTALESLVERTQLGGTEWALGLEARSVALVSDGDAAEGKYREAVDRLERARTLPDLGRAHLLYGEWLRREGRRIDAREQLRAALELFETIGMPGFAERAHRELTASGEKARKRTDETRGDLTAQESQIARLAAEGLTNPQIGAQLYLSARTVEWHLRRVYPKLGIKSRRELPKVLASI